MVINLWYYRSWRWLKYYSISFFFARAVYKYYESPNAIKKYLYSPNAKSSNLYSNCNNDNIMFAKAVQRAVTIHTAPTLSHPTVKLGFILYNTNCNYNNHRCIFSLYGIKKALRSYHSQRSPITAYRYTILSWWHLFIFWGYHSIFLCHHRSSASCSPNGRFYS